PLEDRCLPSSYTIADLGTLGGASSNAGGINTSGQVAGYASTAKGDSHAFRWQAGVMTDLGTLPGGATSGAFAINDAGQVVGDGQSGSGWSHAFRWQAGVMTDLGTLSANLYSSSSALAINASGQVVGDSTDDWGTHAFLWENGMMHGFYLGT